MKGASILFSILSPDPDWEDDFNHWYNNHQIPIRLGCTGFQSAQRYKDPERSVYLGLFEIDTLERLESPEYSKIRSQPNAQSAWMLSNSLQYERYTGDEISTFCAENSSIEEALEAEKMKQAEEERKRREAEKKKKMKKRKRKSEYLPLGFPYKITDKLW